MKIFIYLLLFSISFTVRGQDYFKSFTDISYIIPEKDDSFKNRPSDSLEHYNFNPILDISELKEFEIKNKFREKGTFFLVFESNTEKNVPILEIKDSKDGINVGSQNILRKNSQEVEIFSDTGIILGYSFTRDSHKKKGNSIRFNEEFLSGEHLIKVIEFFYLPDLINSLERQKIMTYLSVKYGVSLSLTSDYINATNDTIWNSKDNWEYSHRVTGIGRDDVFGLYQEKSQNSSKDGITIGIFSKNETDKALVNDSFFLWGDNDLDANFKPKENNDEIYFMERIWRANSYGGEDWMLDIVLDGDQLPLDIEDIKKNNQKLWLVKSSYPEFDMFSDYIEQTFVENSMFGFNEVPMGRGQQKDIYFSFLKVPDFSIIYDLVPPDCEEDGNSTLNVRVLGGEAPFTVILKSNTSVYSYQFDEHLFTLENLASGTLQIEVKDRRGSQYEFAVENHAFEPIAIELAEKWVTTKGEIIEIFPVNKTNGILHYEWMYQNEIISTELSLKTKEEGFYTLIVTNELGCRKEFPFEIIQTNDISENIVLYPNQSRRGEQFNLQFSLDESQDIEILICDMTGKIIKSRKLFDIKNTTYSDFLEVSGTYIVVIKSKNTSITRTLIVQ